MDDNSSPGRKLSPLDLFGEGSTLNEQDYLRGMLPLASALLQVPVTTGHESCVIAN